jgi:large repetitive protein
MPPPRHARNCGLQVADGRLDGVDSVIKNDFVCNDDTASGCSQSAPRLAVDALGDFVVSWYEFRDGDADAWFQRLDSAGNMIGANGRLNTDISMGWQGDPSSAMRPDGRFLFCWEDRRDIGNSDLFGQRFDAAGTRLGSNFRASDSAAGGDQSMSGAWMSPSGVALLAWDDRRFGLTGDIFAQFLNPDGSPMDTNFRVNDDGVGEANQYEPDVSGDSSGRFVVAWMDGRGQGVEDWNVFCQRFNSQGQRIGANVQVTSDASTQWSPDVSCGAGGEFVVTWDDGRSGNWDVYGQRYGADGSPDGQDFKVNDDNGSADQHGSGVAVNEYGEFVVVWTDRRSGEYDVYARRYDAGGSPQGPSFRLSDVSTGSQVDPSIEARPDGGYWAAWADARSGNPDIYCQRLNRNGSKVRTNFRINDDHGSALQRCSSIGMDAHGLICVVWEDERNGATDVYRCVTDAAGSPLGANLRLNGDGPGGAAQYYASVAGGDDRFLAAWTDMRAGSDSTDIYAQYLDGNGTPVGSNFLVNSDGAGASQWYPYVAMDSSNNAVILWMDTRNGPYQMYCRRYDANRNPLGPEFAVQDSTGYGDYGSAAMNRSGRFITAWMDTRSGTSDIYCQSFRADGTRVGGNILVNLDSSGTYHGYPSCAIDEQGRFAVAWEDTRNDVYDVYVQWFDSTGTRIGGNERVNDNSAAGDAYSPSCAFAPDGRLAVEFNDERDFVGNPQIYCQRFGSDRARISFNKKVNEPNLFPNNHHWTVGQSVVVSGNVLAFAWADNRRHKGFDIYAKLTDWDLIGVDEEAGDEGRGTRVAGLPSIVRRDTRLEIGRHSVGAVVWLYDATGRRVRQASVADCSALDLHGVSPGAYFVVSRDGIDFDYRKVVIE